MCIPAGAFELFRERLEDMAYDASQRADGTYRPIESFDLLLLGDIFDTLSSTQWTDEEKGAPGYARPWSRPDDPAFVNKDGKITDEIIALFAVTPLRSTIKNGLPFDQMYLNAGTWRPVHEICDTDSNKKGFVFHKTMGYLGIYREDERRCKA